MIPQNKPSTSLYFLALVPDPFFQAEVLKIKEYIKDVYDSGHALRSPAHITLHMPFKWRDDRIGKLKSALKYFAAGKPRFMVALKNFNAFPPKVIFIQVENNQHLEELQKDLGRTAGEKLKLENSLYKQKGFHPHMTVAFRDLKPAAFKKAWEEFQFKELEHSFEVNSLVLLKHNGKMWEIFKEFRF